MQARRVCTVLQATDVCSFLCLTLEKSAGNPQVSSQGSSRKVLIPVVIIIAATLAGITTKGGK